jgi:hypothetical protein
MTTKSKSKPKQPKEPPKFPQVPVMQTWDVGTVLRWLQQRHPNILEDDDVNIFKRGRINGRAFLEFSVEQFQACDLPLAVAVALKGLADEVKEGKFTLWT